MKLNIEKFKSFSLLSSFLILTIQYIIILYFDLNSSSSSIIQLGSKLVVGSTYVLSFFILFFHEKKINLVIKTYLIFSFILIFNLFLYNENLIVIKENLMDYFLISVPSFILAMSLTNWSAFYRIIAKVSKMVLYLSIIIAILNSIELISIGPYSMALSNYLLLPALIFIDKSFCEKKTANYLYVIISVLLIILLGSRGPLLSIALYTSYKLLKLNYSKEKKIVLILILMILLWVFLSYRVIIFESLYQLFLKHDLDVRTLRLFTEEELHSSGRDYIYSIIINKIKNKPLFGWGLFSDRRILLGVTPYTHNIFLDLWLHFGIIIGTLMILCLLMGGLFPILKDGSFENDILFLWFCIGFVPLLVSRSYLTDFRFWIYLGLLVNYSKQYNSNELKCK